MGPALNVIIMPNNGDFVDAILLYNRIVSFSLLSSATHYGLNGPGIETRWERDFPHPSRPAVGPTQPPIQWVPGRGADYPPHLAPGLK